MNWSTFGLRREAGAASSQQGAPNAFPGELVAAHEPAGVASEAYRMLRTNLFYTQVDSPPKVIMLASADRYEGKTTTTANLGVVLAQADKNTLVLDCDLRNPGLHKMFGLTNVRGLVDILVGGQDP